MAWRCPGDKPLYKPMMVSLLTHICVTRPQWVKYSSLKTTTLTENSKGNLWGAVQSIEFCHGAGCLICRADSTLVPIQWETSLQSNAISYWLGANLESSLILITVVNHKKSIKLFFFSVCAFAHIDCWWTLCQTFNWDDGIVWRIHS